MFNAFAVFLPWAALGLAVALILCVAELLRRLRVWFRFRRSFRAAVRGRRRRYAVTFVNHRGF